MLGKRGFLVVLAVVGALLLTAGGVGFWLIAQAKNSDPLTADAAVATFAEADDGTRGVTGAPQPGVYSYAVVGTEAGGAASLNVSRDLPAEARMIIWQQPGGFATRLVYSGDHLEGATYAISDEGVAQTRTRTKLSLLGTTSDTRADIDPAALWIAEDLSIGDSWTSSYEANGSTTSHSTEVTGREAVVVGAEQIDTFVVERTTENTGDVTGRWTDVYWWSPELNMPVKMSVEGESKEGIGVFSQQATLTLTTSRPLV